MEGGFQEKGNEWRARQFGRDEEFLARNTRFSDSLTDDFSPYLLIMIVQPFCKKKTIDGNLDRRP